MSKRKFYFETEGVFIYGHVFFGFYSPRVGFVGIMSLSLYIYICYLVLHGAFTVGVLLLGHMT